MRVGVLSAGPSLAKTYCPGADTDVRIGVNAAASLFECDWWSCGDGATFARVEPVGRPIVFTMTPDDGHLRTPQVAKRLSEHEVVRWSSIKPRVSPPKCWTNYSITAALALAVDLGASRIDIYGHDMTGTVDCAGYRLAKRAEQWDRKSNSVRGSTNEVVRWCRDIGIEVVQHRPEAALCA